MNGKTFFKLFLSDLDEKMTSAGEKRQKMTLCNSSRNLFRNVPSWIFTRKRKYSLPLTISALRSQQLVPNYFLYPCKCLDFHFGEILSQFCPILWQNKHRSRLADIFDGCIANELTWQKSPEGGIWRKELKNGLQLANKNIIPLSKFGKNRM